MSYWRTAFIWLLLGGTAVDVFHRHVLRSDRKQDLALAERAVDTARRCNDAFEEYREQCRTNQRLSMETMAEAGHRISQCFAVSPDGGLRPRPPCVAFGDADSLHAIRWAADGGSSHWIQFVNKPAGNLVGETDIAFIRPRDGGP